MGPGTQHRWARGRRRVRRVAVSGAQRLAKMAAARFPRAASLWPRPRTLPTASAPRSVTSPQDVVWFHSIDLGDGEVTSGTKSASELAAQTNALCLPLSLAGQTALDIGAWDGFFSFELERRGAKRVVALDEYAWSLDLHASGSTTHG